MNTATIKDQIETIKGFPTTPVNVVVDKSIFVVVITFAVDDSLVFTFSDKKEAYFFLCAFAHNVHNYRLTTPLTKYLEDKSYILLEELIDMNNNVYGIIYNTVIDKERSNKFQYYTPFNG